jgi:hypothetical protein
MYNEHIYTMQHFFLYFFFTPGQAGWPRTFMSGIVHIIKLEFHFFVLSQNKYEQRRSFKIITNFFNNEHLHIYLYLLMFTIFSVILCLEHQENVVILKPSFTVPKM